MGYGVDGLRTVRKRELRKFEIDVFDVCHCRPCLVGRMCCMEFTLLSCQPYISQEGDSERGVENFEQYPVASAQTSDVGNFCFV